MRRNTFTTTGGVMGDSYKYNPLTNEFIVVSQSGVIQTYFKPEVGKHPYSSNLEYFLRQADVR